MNVFFVLTVAVVMLLMNLEPNGMFNSSDFPSFLTGSLLVNYNVGFCESGNKTFAFIKSGNFLNSWVAISFASKAVHRGVRRHEHVHTS
jgi:hypothetical protein